MSSSYESWDHAPLESFFNSLKNERVFHEDYETWSAAKQDVFGYSEAFHNRSRRQSTLGYRNPVQYHV